MKRKNTSNLQLYSSFVFPTFKKLAEGSIRKTCKPVTTVETDIYKLTAAAADDDPKTRFNLICGSHKTTDTSLSKLRSEHKGKKRKQFLEIKTMKDLNYLSKTSAS